MLTMRDYENNEELLAAIVNQAFYKAYKGQKPQESSDVVTIPKKKPREDRMKHVLEWGFRRTDIEEIQQTSGIYIVFSSVTQQVLYIGKSKCLKKRIKSTHHPFQIAKNKRLNPILYIKKVSLSDIDFEECLAIGVLRPSWNFGLTPGLCDY